MPLRLLYIMLCTALPMLAVADDRWVPEFLSDPAACENSEIDALYDTRDQRLHYHNVSGPTKAVPLPPNSTISVVGECKPGAFTHADLVVRGRLFGEAFDRMTLPVDPDCDPGLSYSVYFNMPAADLQVRIRQHYGSIVPIIEPRAGEVIVETSYLREEKGKAVYTCSLNEFD